MIPFLFWLEMAGFLIFVMVMAFLFCILLMYIDRRRK